MKNEKHPKDKLKSSLSKKIAENEILDRLNCRIAELNLILCLNLD